MKSLLRPVLTIAAAALVGGLSASGCAENKATLFVVGVQQVKPPECELKADSTTPILLGGTLDVALRANYRAGLLVGNQYTPRGDKENLRVETTRVNLRGAEIELRDTNGDLLDCGDVETDFSVHGTGFVNPNKGSDAGFGAFSADLIPESVGYCLAGMVGAGVTMEVIATVRVFGETTGGQDITSGELTYPITVCSGCLIDYPSEAIDTNPDAAVPFGCNLSLDKAPEQSCHPGQDALVDCRNCPGVALCQAVP